MAFTSAFMLTMMRRMVIKAGIWTVATPLIWFVVWLPIVYLERTHPHFTKETLYLASLGTWVFTSLSLPITYIYLAWHSWITTCKSCGQGVYKLEREQMIDVAEDRSRTRVVDSYGVTGINERGNLTHNTLWVDRPGVRHTTTVTLSRVHRCRRCGHERNTVKQERFVDEY